MADENQVSETDGSAHEVSSNEEGAGHTDEEVEEEEEIEEVFPEAQEPIFLTGNEALAYM